MTNKFQKEPPKIDISEGMQNLIHVWQEMAHASSHIASAKRTLYLAYLSEGFTEAHALELSKSF